MTHYAILIDTTTCVGCYECERACADRWGFPYDEEIHKLSATQNTAIDQLNEVYVPRMCMHCADPTCVSACPVGAFHKTAEGPVIYEAAKCIGCRYCMQACPFTIPRYEWSSLNPRVTKCDMCRDRILSGARPACVDSCPADSRFFGTMETVLAEAKRRITENPESYNPHIYGRREIGGTSVVYLANHPFGTLGFPTNLPENSLPDLTWAVMSKIPNYVFWAGTLLGGIWWITNRRKEVQEYEKKLHEKESQDLGRRDNGERSSSMEGGQR